MTNKLIEAMARALEYNPQRSGWVSYENDAQAVLKAISESGYAVVPREPTKAMLQAYLYPPDFGEDFDRNDGSNVTEAYDRAVGRATWGAMVHAAVTGEAPPLPPTMPGTIEGLKSLTEQMLRSAAKGMFK